MKDVLKHHNFIASVHYSAEDEIFHGKIMGIDDSVTFEGDSVEKLKEAFIEAVDDYVEICKEVGKNPHKSYKGSFNVRIKPDLHKKVAYKSVELGVSLNQLVEKAIARFVSEEQDASLPPGNNKQIHK